MFITGIDHIQIAAPPGCEAEARRFFGTLLGLEELQKPAVLADRGGCWFKVGASQLHVGIESAFRPAKKAHPAFAVSDAEALFRGLAQNGVNCTWDGALENVRRFFAEDPWGNRLEFTEQPQPK
jgi:catechol 2,3-dioxygenase-like lactoylglutathione lyase family enzyme